MTEITIKEIPVQILDAPDGSTLIVRVPDCWSDEQAALVLRPLGLALGNRNVSIAVIPESVSLAVAKNE